MSLFNPTRTMVALNTRQRDMLRFLLDHSGRTNISSLAEHLQLTPRQVNYALKGVKVWLDVRSVDLLITPGVGVEIICTPTQRDVLLSELGSDRSIDLILSAGQRRQLICFIFLTNTGPIYLSTLQEETGVSRSTVLKDIDDAADWLGRFSLTLERRPNYGLWIDGSEHQQRQALAALLWGAAPFEEPLWSMTHTAGLGFALAEDAHILNILRQVTDYDQALDIPRGLARVAFAEADMGGRFTDREVLHLALTLSIQFQRMTTGRFLNIWPLEDNIIDRLASGSVWKVSEHLLESHSADLSSASADQIRWETALIAAYLLAGPKNHRWPGDSEIEKEFEGLIAQLLKDISEAYELSALKYDTTLRDGLITNLIPACLRARYQLWSPPLQLDNLLPPDQFAFEYEIAHHLTKLVEEKTGVRLPDIEISNLALILRAAYIRERPQVLKDVLVVCPSGMATAQLLVARLRARFNRLGNLSVISLRELSDRRHSHIDLIISTVPIELDNLNAEVIQVHPLLLPEDIAAITQWLAQ